MKRARVSSFETAACLLSTLDCRPSAPLPILHDEHNLGPYFRYSIFSGINRGVVLQTARKLKGEQHSGVPKEGMTLDFFQVAVPSLLLPHRVQTPTSTASRNVRHAIWT